jgi:hypothetical protein
MLRSWVVGRSFQRTKRSLTSHASLQLLLNFLRGALFERVCAAARSQPCDRKQDRKGLHPLILEIKSAKANRPDFARRLC